jgi:hypothetical protein
MEGYADWGIPDFTDDDSKWKIQCHDMKMQFYYGQNAQNEKFRYYPKEQLHHMMGKFHQRKLKEYESKEEFQNGNNDVYVLLIQLHPSHLKGASDKKVWRLVTCHADTNLEAFHDQIICPAMGWRRHYHGYKFIIPTSGVVFGPEGSDAVDIGHFPGYTLNAAKFDLRHVLRKMHQRLHYVYDLGDSWRHDITLIGRVKRGTAIDLDFFDNYRYYFVQEELERMSTLETDEWSLEVNKSGLIAGAINCPPEDSRGCSTEGNYGSILKKGKYHHFCPNFEITNWSEECITCAYNFRLERRQNKVQKAITQRPNPTDGCLLYVVSSLIPPSKNCLDSDEDTVEDDSFPRAVGGNNRRQVRKGPKSEVLWKENSCTMCANCFKQKPSNTGLTLSTCSRCRAVKYCGGQCQREHWKRVHKHECRK